MTIYASTGISINVQSSLFAPVQVDYGSLTDTITGYVHQIDADGGYRRATITLTMSMEEAEDWFECGLMRHITVYNDAMLVIWQGFVNIVSLAIGGLQISRGPVLEITNYLGVSYTRLDISVDPPVTGTQTYTPASSDAASIALYGRLSEIVSGGTVTDAEARQIRDTYLAERKDPQLSQSLDITAGAAVQVSLECAGYIEYLNHNRYNLASTSMTTVLAKLLAVLAAEPNGLLSTDYTQIAANTLATPALENKSQSLMSIIKGLVALGDATYQRYTFGLYAGRRAVYQPVPASFDYQYQMRPVDSVIEIYPGGEVYPWDVLPARWLFYSNFLPGRGAISGSLRLDPRAQFIESVTYTAPVEDVFINHLFEQSKALFGY